MPDSQPDVSELAREVVDELEDTRQIGDQLLLSRREAIALSTGAVSLGALGVVGAGSATAQEAAGQIGTASDPVDVEGAQGNFSQAVSVDGALEAEAVSTEKTAITKLAGRATISDDQDIVDGSITELQFDRTDFDHHDEFDETNHHIVAHQDGTLFISLTIRWDGSPEWSTGDRVQTQPHKNGSGATDWDQFRKVGDETETTQIGWELIEVSENDEIDIRVVQDSGADQTAESSTTALRWVVL